MYPTNLQIYNFTHSDSGIGVGRIVKVELVEQLRKPEPESIVAKLYGEVDHHHDDRVAQVGGRKELFGLVNGLQYQGNAELNQAYH